jgi:GTPase SAR1 family protein
MKRDEVRILLIGDRNVGKTSLILSLVRKPNYQYRHKPDEPFKPVSI